MPGHKEPRVSIGLPVYNAGALSLVIIMVCGFFVGAVLALQAYSNMSIFNAEDWTGVAAHLALVKELGPVMTAIRNAPPSGVDSAAIIIVTSGVPVASRRNSVWPG